jgi:glycosyltransferase involved in cell wall biosynthesis
MASDRLPNMPLPPAPELRYGIDRLEARGARIFGWGWIAHRTRAITAIELRVSGNGWERLLPADFGRTRDDVERAFPDLVNAKFSGFMVTGYAERSPVHTLVLEIAYADRGIDAVDVSSTLQRAEARARKWRELRWVAAAAWRRIRQGDLRGLVRRIRSQNYLAPSLDDIGIAETLWPKLPAGKPVTIIFDHQMGGGANLYRRHVIDDRVAAGGAVVLCTYNMPTLDYRLTLYASERSEDVFRLSSFVALEPLLERVPAAELFVNSPVSFDDPLLFADWVARMRFEHPDMRLIVTAHDYFAVCPSFVLLNADGNYCGIPDLAECNRCLPRHRASYVTLSPPTTIPVWRASWGRCLAAADEVRCFSGSTRSLLLRGHPGLDPTRVTVVPHRVNFHPRSLPRVRHSEPLTVGVLGHVSVQKGALIVRDVVSRIERAHPAARVVVIGTLDLAVSSSRLVVTGPYPRENLADIIQTHGVNMILFPSICPETFSYVIEESMLLRLPIVAFDLGAPGERLRDYDLGRLAATVDAEAALATMVELHTLLAAREAALA